MGIVRRIESGILVGLAAVSFASCKVDARPVSTPTVEQAKVMEGPFETDRLFPVNAGVVLRPNGQAIVCASGRKGQI